MELIKVVDGRDFGLRWDGWYIKLSDYENINCSSYEQELWDLFENCSFVFDEDKHEVWDIG